MNPRREDARVLRKLFLGVLHIRDHQDKQAFLAALGAWENQYGGTIGTAPARGRVFSDLQKARSMLLKAVPYMFPYLDDKEIVMSTNSVEGYFGRMKQKYRQHPGLAEHRKDAYFRWYLHLVRK